MEPYETGLHAPYDLAPDRVDAYDRDGYVHLSGVLSPAVLERYGQEITRSVLDLAREDRPLEERDTYGRAFLQVTNLWRQNERVREFVLGRRLGRIAARLLGVPGVRLYHDQALYKEPAGGHTPWHADHYYWPMATDRCVTAWIPLQETPKEMGPLEFAVGSHTVEVARDLPIGDASEARIQDAVSAHGFEIDASGYALGDVSFHAGWTLHRAGPNTTGEPRRVMTVIYMDRDMRLAEPANENQELDRQAFCPGVVVGDIIDSPLNPIIYEPGPSG